MIYKDVPLSEETALDGVKGRILDMTVTVRPGDGGYREFTMHLAKGGGCYAALSFQPHTGEVRIDRSFSGFDHDIVHNRSLLVDAGEEVEIRVILDRFSAELFFNGGKQTATMTLYTPQEFDGITFGAEGNARIDVETYDLHF